MSRFILDRNWSYDSDDVGLKLLPLYSSAKLFSLHVYIFIILTCNYQLAYFWWLSDPINIMYRNYYQCAVNQAFAFLRFRWSSGWTSVALVRREFTTSSFFLLKIASISFNLISVSLSRATWVVDVVPACCKNWLKQSMSESCWAYRSFKSFEFLVFGLFIGFYFFSCFGASVFEFLNPIYERLESSNPGFLQAQAYTGGLVERSWKLPFRPLRVFGSLGIVEPPWSFVNGWAISLFVNAPLERDSSCRDSESSSAKLVAHDSAACQRIIFKFKTS